MGSSDSPIVVGWPHTRWTDSLLGRPTRSSGRAQERVGRYSRGHDGVVLTSE